MLKEEDGDLGRRLVANMPRMTLDRIGRLGIDNARRNLRFLKHGKSLRELRGQTSEKGSAALVLGAGPSLHRGNVAVQIKERGFEGTIVATDSCMSYCLRNDIVPDLVVTLDPHAKRILRWFGDPDLGFADSEVDDYHRRQDMDPAFADEQQHNHALLDLLDRHGKTIRIALSTSASEVVVERVLETGMEIYWWNPMFDDPGAPDSLTCELYETNRLPCVNAGGNVGTACWMMADAVLGKKHVGLSGFDFSYYIDTPYEKTQYYKEALELVGADQLDKFFIPIFNPNLSVWFYTDPAYFWYRENFLEMVKDANCTTYNCTEGGILFGERIHFITLSDFLNRFATAPRQNHHG
jgi:hypothetical protein